VSEAGLRTNIDVGIQYLEAWLRGTGAVPLYNLMEDAATAEISRAQVWQWIHHRVRLSDGRVVTEELVYQVIKEELGKIRRVVGEERFHSGRYQIAGKLFRQVVMSQEFEDFLTLPAYEYL
jgi:malate synthase